MLKAKDLMTACPRFVQVDDVLFDVAVLMRDLDIGCLFVCENERVRGVVTDRDIAIRGAARGREPLTTPVSEVMTVGVIAVNEETPIECVGWQMASYGIRRIGVVEDTGQIVGVIALGDLVGHPEIDPGLILEIVRPVAQKRIPSPLMAETAGPVGDIAWRYADNFRPVGKAAAVAAV